MAKRRGAGVCIIYPAWALAAWSRGWLGTEELSAALRGWRGLSAGSRHLKRDEAERRLRRGEGTREIAQALGMRASQVSRWKKALGVPMQHPGRRGHSPEFKDRALKLAAEVGIERAAEQVGVHPKTISTWRTMERRKGGQR